MWPGALALIPLLAALAAGPAAAQSFAGAESLEGINGAIRNQDLAREILRAAAPKPRASVEPGGPGAMGVSRYYLPPEAGAEEAPDVGAYPVRGVDVSHYQGVIDWPKAAASGVSFVYMKATESTGYVDETFARNWDGAAAAGLSRGAYHFWNFCQDGGAQADLFVKTVPASPSMLPPVVDLEQSGSCRTLPSRAAFRAGLAAFAAKVKAAYGRTPILYVNYSIYQRYFSGENGSYRFWIADVRHARPSLPVGWTLWQYGWHGSVPGIPGEVDVNAFNGTREALASLETDTGVMVASLP
jgi:lysozyme